MLLDNGVGFMPKAEGGVGLANVRERLKPCTTAGRADHRRAAGGGTCATIKLPYEIAPAPPPPDRTSASMHPLPAPTAVVADDERLMRDQIIARLKAAWPELLIVGEAGNGHEAVAMVQSLQPDIVFLDISMPDERHRGGPGAGRPGPRGLRHAHDQYAIRAFEQGAIDYLLKPAEPERVALTCQRLRERMRQAPDPMNDLLAQLSQRLGRAASSRASTCAGYRPTWAPTSG